METAISEDMPDTDIGPHCLDPHECDYFSHCWSHVPDSSIFNLYRLRQKDKFDLYSQGILDYEQIPDDQKLSKIQQTQVHAAVTGEIMMNKRIIKDFLDSITYPVSFFDFETFRNPIPRFDGQKPYMQIPFQYSLHVVEDEYSLAHYEFLGDHENDPRRSLCEKLIRDMPKNGTIVAYNKSFEISRLKELAKEFDDLKNDLLAITERFVDLVVPFRSGGYYHPAFNGSFSIKSVLPALFPDDEELSYNTLAIQNGVMAMDTFANLHLLEDMSLLPQIRMDLLAYCKLDTLAMVRIWEKLVQLSK